MKHLPEITLILGGASSGKSSVAESMVESTGLPKTYIATAQALDDEMGARISRHQIARGPDWTTLEIPLDLSAGLTQIQAGSVVLIDCATMWLSNHLMANSDLDAEIQALISTLKICKAPIVMVSNEVGLGGVPENTLARKFGQAQGALNIALARNADLVVQVTAGLPMVLKGQLPT